MSAPAPHQTVEPGDTDRLAELIATFTDATSRLQATHETLRAEVQRLEGELRETKGQLARARELAALGEMAAGIAHEIRNPLGSIKLYAKVLVDDLTDREPERETASKIARAVDGLNAVVGDVLTFSREIRLETTPTSVRDLVERALECCADRHDDIDVELLLDDATCAADTTLAHQALVNVLRNACDALREQGGGRVRISTGGAGALDHDGHRRRYARITVDDSGPGIPADVRQRMFNPFFTTRAAGTGLGLPIVHRILDAHDGRITIDDAPAPLHGARVELLFPLATDEGASAAHHPDNENHQGEAA